MPASEKLFRLSRTFWAVLGSIALILIAAYAFGFQTVMYFELRAEQRKLPILDLTPQPVSTTAISTSPTLQLSHHGYAADSPWTDLDPSKTKISGGWGVFAFRSGSTITFCVIDAGQEDLRATAAKHFVGTETLKAMVGKDAMASDFSFQNALLHQTTSGLKPWMKERDVARMGVLLTLKAISSVGGNTGLFQVEDNNWHGFQFDEPAKEPKSVALELFDKSENHVEIVLRPNTRNAIRLTQEDINRIVRSLKPEVSGIAANAERAQAVAARDSDSTR